MRLVLQNAKIGLGFEPLKILDYVVVFEMLVQETFSLRFALD